MWKVMLFLLVVVLFLFPAVVRAQDVGGRWCAQGSGADCLVITVSKASAEVVTAVFQDGGRTYAEASGYARDGKVAVAFRRTNARDIGYATMHLRDANTADARTFNPDGTQRWKGVYVRAR